MISKREILDVVQNKLESLELFQTVLRPENATSELKLLDLLPELTRFPAAVLIVRHFSRQDTHLASMQFDLVVIGRYFGLETERAVCESIEETTEEAFRQTGCIDFENRGQALVMLDEAIPMELGPEYLAWELSFEVKILNY